MVWGTRTNIKVNHRWHRGTCLWRLPRIWRLPRYRLAFLLSIINSLRGTVHVWKRNYLMSKPWPDRSQSPFSKTALAALDRNLKNAEGSQRFYGSRIQTWELKFAFSVKKSARRSFINSLRNPSQILWASILVNSQGIARVWGTSRNCVFSEEKMDPRYFQHWQ